MICDLCESVIPAKRLAAVPTTRLCVSCKSTHDEPLLRGDARVLSGSMAEGSAGDLEEKQLEVRKSGGLIS